MALDAVADRRDRAHPFVTEAHRETRVTVVQVGHVAPEEIDVGATHANPLDINDDRPRLGNGGCHFADLDRKGCGDDKGAHQTT